jgi:hypothetical protein
VERLPFTITPKTGFKLSGLKLKKEELCHGKMKANTGVTFRPSLWVYLWQTMT